MLSEGKGTCSGVIPESCKPFSAFEARASLRTKVSSTFSKQAPMAKVLRCEPGTGKLGGGSNGKPRQYRRWSNQENIKWPRLTIPEFNVKMRQIIKSPPS